MKLVWTPEAKQQLHEVIAYIAQDSLSRALAYGKKIETRARTLQNFPHMGRPVPELVDEFPHLKEILIDTYRLVYTIHGKSVIILTLFHGRRRFPAK